MVSFSVFINTEPNEENLHNQAFERRSYYGNAHGAVFLYQNNLLLSDVLLITKILTLYMLLMSELNKKTLKANLALQYGCIKR